MGYYKTNIVNEEKEKKLREFFKILNPMPLDIESAILAKRVFQVTKNTLKEFLIWKLLNFSELLRLNGLNRKGNPLW